MSIVLALLAPIFGIFGVISGILLNEFMRRKNRREVFAGKIFEKRLAAYEGLNDHIHRGVVAADEVIENAELSPSQRHELISATVSEIANYVDKHQLYIDQEIGAHCTALFMGVEDIPEAAGEVREALVRDYRTMRKDAFQMIAEDSGIAEINKLFKVINRPDIGGPLIERIRELRKQIS